ncbi:MAG: hypothetical protein IPM16_06830 [Chloroflexi bacterium]|nr:hypothetical protein [Chloroflexota bacterium]
MTPRSSLDPATQAAYDGGIFAKILREAAEDRQRKRQDAAARPPLSAAVFVDDDDCRSSAESLAISNMLENAPDAETGAAMLREVARARLRESMPAFWMLEELANPALAATPRTRQPSLPPPVGDGQDWRKRPRKRRAPTARPRVERPVMRPLAMLAAG